MFWRTDGRRKAVGAVLPPAILPHGMSPGVAFGRSLTCSRGARSHRKQRGWTMQPELKHQPRLHVVLRLPMTPSHNAMKRWHWAKYSKFRDGLQWKIRQQLLTMRVKAPWQRLVPINDRGTIVSRKNGGMFEHDAAKTQLTITRHSAGELDYGNLVGGCKPLLDALVREGLIFDDSPTWLDDAYAQKPAKQKQGYTEVEVYVP